jgi:manganese transport protein
VILSLQLPFAVFPLVMFTSDPTKMGRFVNPPWVKALAWSVAVIIGALNIYLLYRTFVSL